MNDLFDTLLRANIIAALAVALVAAARPVARRLLGVEMAYQLWILPVIALAATIAPAREVLGTYDATVAGSNNLVLLWLAGAVGVAAWFMTLQMHYGSLARRGKAGPAVIGVIVPKIYMPADDGSFTPGERDIIRMHEREHILRGDPGWNAVLALLQCLFWFNPFMHVAARLMREDQELACDAAVLRRRAPNRAAYAQALLKAQMQSHPIPLGASWLAGSTHPLEVRVALLGRRPPRGAAAAPLVILVLSLAAAFTTWFAQPPAQKMSAESLPSINVAPIMAILLMIALGCTLSWQPRRPRR